jgi:hypothetical protein
VISEKLVLMGHGRSKASWNTISDVLDPSTAIRILIPHLSLSPPDVTCFTCPCLASGCFS